jgi:hypothetical protein
MLHAAGNNTLQRIRSGLDIAISLRSARAPNDGSLRHAAVMADARSLSFAGGLKTLAESPANFG